MLHYLFFWTLYIIWILTFLGYGSTLYNFFHHALREKRTILENHIYITIYGIMGMIVVTTTTTIINFFMPVNIYIAIVIILTGLSLFILNKEKILSSLYKSDVIMLCILAGVILLAIPLLWREYYDTGLYHLAAVKWVVESTTPLGLANLHSRFGFNNSWFILGACVDQYMLHANKPYFILNGITAFFYGSAVFLVIKNKFLRSPAHNATGQNSLSLGDLFLFLSLFAWIGRSGFFLSSIYPDLPVMLFSLLVTCLLIYDFEKFNNINGYSWLAFFVSVYALTIKLSAAPLVFCSLTLLAIRKYIEKLRNPKTPNSNTGFNRRSRTPGVLFTVAAALILLPWAARGVLLSGCLAFPSTIGHFAGLPWALDAPAVSNMSDTITAWSRIPGPDALESLSGWDWIWPWFLRNIKHLAEPVTLCVFGMAITLYSIFKDKRIDYNKKDDPIIWIVPLFAAITGIVFWFLAAPGPRFGYGYLYSPGLLLCCFGLMQKPILDFRRVPKLRTTATCTVVFIIVYGLLINTYLWATKSNGFSFPAPEIVERKTTQGALIYTPAQGDQVWNSPLPNTPYFNEDLKVEISERTGLPKMFWIPSPQDELEK